MIDTVFADNEKIRRIWHEYYDILLTWKKADIKEQEVADNIAKSKYFELIKEIAENLDYKKFSELSLDKYYEPQLWGDEAIIAMALRRELLRVLINTSDIVVNKMDMDQIPEFDREIRRILFKRDSG